MILRYGHRVWLTLLLLTAVLICVAVSSGILMALVRTLGIPGPQIGPLPPTGGLPEKSLTLKGRLAYEDGVYKLDVSALPGYVVALRFATPELENWAEAHLGQNVAVSGYWDKAQPSIFLVESVESSS